MFQALRFVCLLFVLFVVVQGSKYDTEAFPMLDMVGGHSRANVSLREWPYTNWLYGPPCPSRYRQQLLPIDSADIQLALTKVEDALKLYVREMEGIGLKVGVSVGIVYDQQVLFSEGFGTINARETTPPIDTTVFNIGSVTKIFTSLGLYHSVQENLVSLTDPVTKFFNEENPPVFSIHNPYSSEGSAAVTLHSLASQASGLPREAYCGAYPVTENCTDNEIAAQLNLEHLSNFGLLYSPFTGSHYSNLGLALLGRSLERVWGQQYEDYMVNNIFPAIGMNTMTGFTYSQNVIDNMATGYVVVDNGNGTYSQVPAVSTNTEEFGWSAPAGGAYTNRQDMLSFLKWVFGSHENNTVLSQSYLNEYIAPGMLMANAIELYGQGTWEIFYANGYWTLTKGGLTSSMATSISMVPELKLGVSVMMNINSGVNSDKLNALINSIMVPALLAALDKVQEPLSLPPNYQSFIGSYGYSTPFLVLSESSTENGVLDGSVIVTGNVKFIWDSKQDYGNFTAFRYSSTKKYASCMNLAGAGNNAIAYFHFLKNGRPAVTINDENVSFYSIPMMDS